MPKKIKKIGVQGTVSFKVQLQKYIDSCISTNCGKPRKPVKIMPSPYSKHDPRFYQYPKRAPKRKNI